MAALRKWAIERNVGELDSIEFRVYLVCFIAKYPEKATPDMLVAFSFLCSPVIEA